jgi:hypothetical protein
LDTRYRPERYFLPTLDKLSFNFQKACVLAEAHIFLDTAALPFCNVFLAVCPGLDQIQDEMKKEKESGKTRIKRPKDVDLPGLGQFFCMACECVHVKGFSPFHISNPRIVGTLSTRRRWRSTSSQGLTRNGATASVTKVPPSVSHFLSSRLTRLKEEQHTYTLKIDNGTQPKVKDQEMTN